MVRVKYKGTISAKPYEHVPPHQFLSLNLHHQQQHDNLTTYTMRCSPLLPPHQRRTSVGLGSGTPGGVVRLLSFGGAGQSASTSQQGAGSSPAWVVSFRASEGSINLDSVRLSCSEKFSFFAMLGARTFWLNISHGTNPKLRIARVSGWGHLFPPWFLLTKAPILNLRVMREDSAPRLQVGCRARKGGIETNNHGGCRVNWMFETTKTTIWPSNMGNILVYCPKPANPTYIKSYNII